MATSSFDKNFVVSSPEAEKRLREILDSKKPPKPINKALFSNEAIARSEKLLAQYFTRSKR